MKQLSSVTTDFCTTKKLLIDLDYALDLDLKIAELIGPRGIRTVSLESLFIHPKATNFTQGTPPFMAVAILFDPDKKHSTRFDLESILYVLMYVCAVFQQPGPNRPSESIELLDKDKPKFILDWLYPISAYNLACVKRGQLSMRIDEWQKEISNHFLPYWNPLKNCIWRLKKAVAAQEATHEIFINILQETLNSLTDDENNTVGDDLTLPDGATMGNESRDESSDSDEVGYDSPTPAPRNYARKRTSSTFIAEGLPDKIKPVETGVKFKRSKFFYSAGI